MLLAEAELALAAERLEDAQRVLAELDREPTKSALSGAEQQQLAKLRADYHQRLSNRQRVVRNQVLAEAKNLVDHQLFGEALIELKRLDALEPIAADRERASALTGTINARRQRSELFGLLGSGDTAKLRQAFEQLRAIGTDATPLLDDAMADANPQVVAGALEYFAQPDLKSRLPQAALGLLSSADRPAVWPVAAAILTRSKVTGAGKGLLKLALTDGPEGQRKAALTALASVPDPPRNTLVVLLPMLSKDGSELGLALAAAAHAAELHHQNDVAGRRGLPANLTREQDAALDALPARLKTLVTAQSSDVAPAARQAAVQLGIATHLVSPHVLEHVRVLRTNGENPLSPASAVVDGKWSPTDPTCMWLHPGDEPAAIVLDLGEEHTVAAVQVWNYNQSGYQHRGFKEVEVFVSGEPSLMTPQAVCELPIAPGLADQPDFCSMVPVPLARGRYVKLQSRSAYRPDGASGLAEVRVWVF